MQKNNGKIAILFINKTLNTFAITKGGVANDKIGEIILSFINSSELVLSNDSQPQIINVMQKMVK